MSCQEAYQEPYTKYPNRYNDVIKPRLTDTQRDICDTVIRMTYGWHQESAAISNAIFAKKANKTVQGIIKAKKPLIEMGLLVELEKGGGRKASRYMLNLYYDDPERCYKVKVPKEEQKDQEEIPPLEETSEKDVQTIEEAIDEKTGASAEEINQEKEAEISCNESLENSDDTEDCELPTTKLCLEPDINNYNNPDLNNKQTIASNIEKEDRKKAIATVRYEFLNLFPDQSNPDDDYPYFGWAIKTYGLNMCMDKLKLLQEYHKIHEVSNPKGLFRMSLMKDYQPNRYVREKLRADECAKRAVERSSRDSEEWQQVTTNYDYEAAQAALQKLIETLK